jgi:ABC-2 type transport system permease protein
VILSVLRAMLLGLIRDRGALLLSFALPAAFFLVFAMIFVGGTGEGNGASPTVRVALGAEDPEEPATRNLLAAIAAEGALIPVDEDGDVAEEGGPPILAPDSVRELVRGGDADAGLIVRSAGGLLPQALFSAPGEGETALILVEDPARAVAAQVLAGLTQKALFTALPAQALELGVSSFEQFVAPLSSEQRESFEGVLRELEQQEGAGAGEAGSPLDLNQLFATETVAGTDDSGETGSLAAYYAGAIAVLFMLFASFGGASLLHDELDRGILDRVLAGPGGLAPLLTGKLLYLVVVGSLQVLEIYLLAWLLYGVPFVGRGFGFAITTLATAFACAGIGLLLVAACRTKAQAAAVSTIAILLASALGGSMVPRFLMPDWMRSVGWLTPNAWAIEAYNKIFWLGEPVSALAAPVAVLVGFGAVSFLIAQLLVRRWAR